MPILFVPDLRAHVAYASGVVRTAASPASSRRDGAGFGVNYVRHGHAFTDEDWTAIMDCGDEQLLGLTGSRQALFVEQAAGNVDRRDGLPVSREIDGEGVGTDAEAEGENQDETHEGSSPVGIGEHMDVLE